MHCSPPLSPTNSTIHCQLGSSNFCLFIYQASTGTVQNRLPRALPRTGLLLLSLNTMPSASSGSTHPTLKRPLYDDPRRCPSGGCFFLREVAEDGLMRRHCCSRCGREGSSNHNKHCRRLSLTQLVVTPPVVVSPVVAPFASPHEEPGTQPEAEEPGTQPEAEPPLQDIERPLHHRCRLVTMGLKPEAYGAWLLDQNPRLRPHVLDVRKYLRGHTDWQERGGLWGTSISTQDRIRQTEGFEVLLEIVLGRIMRRPLVILVCYAGHHRSVATAEIANRCMEELQSPNMTIEVIHVDAQRCTADQWGDLLNADA